MYSVVLLISLGGLLLWWAYSAGKENSELKQSKDTLDAVQKANEVEANLRRKPGSAIDRLREHWME